VTVISTVLEEIDENIKSSRISSEVHIRRRIFSHLLRSLLTTVAVGGSAALLGAICGEMNNISYDETVAIGLMSALYSSCYIVYFIGVEQTALLVLNVALRLLQL
jgi:hypothetical protein